MTIVTPLHELCEPRSALDPARFRQALGAFATGVTIITTQAEDGMPVGVTANSFNSVSLEPPMVLWSLARKSGSCPAFISAEHWAVHILAWDQHELSSRFARPISGAEKFADLAWELDSDGNPLLSGCTTRMQCRTVHMYDGGDHIIFVGEVIGLEKNDVPPLVFQGGNYAIATSTRQAVPPPVDEDPRNVSANSSLGYLLASASLYYNARIYSQAKLLNVTEVEHLVLMALYEREARTCDEIITLVNYTGRSIGIESINDLEARELVRIDDESGCADSENLMIHLTDTGREVAARLNAESERLEMAIMEQLGTADTLALCNLLSRFNRIYRPMIPYRWF